MQAFSEQRLRDDESTNSADYHHLNQPKQITILLCNPKHPASKGLLITAILRLLSNGTVNYYDLSDTEKLLHTKGLVTCQAHMVHCGWAGGRGRGAGVREQYGFVSVTEEQRARAHSKVGQGHVNTEQSRAGWSSSSAYVWGHSCGSWAEEILVPARDDNRRSRIKDAMDFAAVDLAVGGFSSESILAVYIRGWILTNISYGVPQGSILSPILFFKYVNDLNQSIQNEKMVQYADNMTHCVKARTVQDLETITDFGLRAIESCRDAFRELGLLTALRSFTPDQSALWFETGMFTVMRLEAGTIFGSNNTEQMLSEIDNLRHSFYARVVCRNFQFDVRVQTSGEVFVPVMTTGLITERFLQSRITVRSKTGSLTTVSCNWFWSSRTVHIQDTLNRYLIGS
ncbi:hypothetical protein J6590_052158 [Homalodisca vitripennis]|nr:hypothetical protein J6590_052158 [Homalodisca vitripennis]